MFLARPTQYALWTWYAPAPDSETICAAACRQLQGHGSANCDSAHWCRVIIDAETGLLAQQTQHHNSTDPFPANRCSMESRRSSCEEQRSVDGSQAGRVSHRLSRESSGANPLPLSCRQSLEAPSLGRRASTTITEGLLASVTESETPLMPEQQVCKFLSLGSC